MSQTENSNSLCLNLEQANNLHIYFSKKINQTSKLTTVSETTINDLFAKSFAFNNGYDEFTYNLHSCKYYFQIDDIDIKGMVDIIVRNDVTNTGPNIYVSMYSELIKPCGVNNALPYLENFLTRFWVIMEAEYTLSHIISPRAASLPFWSMICNSALTNKTESDLPINLLSNGRLNYMEMYTQKHASIFLDSSKAVNKLDKAEAVASSDSKNENKLRIIAELKKGLSERIILLILSVSFFEKANANALPDPLATALSLLDIEHPNSEKGDTEDAADFSMNMWKGIVVEITKSHPDMFDVIMQIDKYA
tara:strand:+ start:2787 stop:3707 length:921 start_codon:yes stop_codon:yes gene_type:complete